jgi:hypothetical protein
MTTRTCALLRPVLMVAMAWACIANPTLAAGLPAGGGAPVASPMRVAAMALPRTPTVGGLDARFAGSIEAAVEADLAWLGYEVVQASRARAALGGDASQALTQRNVKRLLSQVGASGVVAVRVLSANTDGAGDCLLAAWNSLGELIGSRLASGPSESVAAAAAALIADALIGRSEGAPSAALTATRADLRGKVTAAKESLGTLQQKLNDNENMISSRQLQRRSSAKAPSIIETQTDQSLSQLSETYRRQISQLEQQIITLQAQIEATGVPN